MSLPPLLSEKDEGLRRAKIKYHENAYTEAFKNGYLLDDDMLKSDHIRQYSKNKNRHSHYMITINFPKTFTDYEIMEKVVRKKWMFRWEYTWEYHTEGENHPHVNMIIHKNKPPSEVQREIA